MELSIVIRSALFVRLRALTGFRTQGFKTADFAPVPSPFSSAASAMLDYQFPPRTNYPPPPAVAAADNENYLTDIQGYTHILILCFIS